jgi:O-antigen/teichoic acid export membrane protein
MNLSQLKNKHILALIGNLVISGFSVLTIALLYRVLSKNDMGIWFFFLTISGLADAIRNGFLTTATVKFYAGTTKERGKAVLGSVWYLAIALTLGIALLSFVVLAFSSFIHSEQLLIVLKWLGITFISSLPFSVTFWILIAEEDYLKILGLRIVNNGGMIVTIALFALLHKASLQNVLIINVVTNVITSIVTLVLGYAKFSTIKHKATAIIQEILHFGKYSLSTNMSANLLTTVNTILITFLLSPATLAIYNAPQRLMEVVEIPLRSFIGTGMSAMATAYNNKNMHHLVHVTKKYAGMLCLAFIPIIIIVLIGADYAVLLLGGGKYTGTEAANILRLLIVVSFLYPIDRFNGVTLDIIQQQKVNFYKVLVMQATNIPVTFFGILLLHSIWGAAIAIPFATLAGIIFGYYHLRKHIDYTIGGIFKTGFIESRNLFYQKILPKLPFKKAKLL